ncbi:MAG: hypothetical protein M3N53_14655 [Actinomycetota bacterium]|nr:hypothetical protein [Actinomycetota bacterium]
MRRLTFALLVLVLVISAACAEQGGGDPAAAPPDGGDELIVQPANYDLVAGEESRFIVGLLTADQLFVSFGDVGIEFFYLGTREGEGTAEEGPTATGAFLAIDAPADAAPQGPAAVPGSEGRGVYAADVTFDRAGFWAAQVTAALEEGPITGRGVFEVLEEHRYPAVGEPAPRTDNLTLASTDAPLEAVDSRARAGEPVPDKSLHQVTIADAIRRREPALVVFSTPVYCVSRFCGPVTDVVHDLQNDYGDRANFIHIEVWRDFQNTVVNKGAAEWIYRGDDLTEPWVYLIGADGKIDARWDNVATRSEIEPLLKELPVL